MRIKPIIIGLILLVQLFILTFIIEPEYEKIAFVIQPPLGTQEDHYSYLSTEITNEVKVILESLNYSVIVLKSKEDIIKIKAKQVVIFYAGHGISNSLHMMQALNDNISILEVLSAIDSLRLIMVTGMCYGGYWLTFASEGRFIVSTSNDTAGLVKYSNTVTGFELLRPNILDYMRYNTRHSLEESYMVWSSQMYQLYLEYSQPYKTVMYDGITGDVWL